MIEVIFTIDYEIYGSGQGRIEDLVYEPTRQLMNLFDRANAKLVVFAEAAEFEKIAEAASDPYIGKVYQQLRDLHDNGHEIALHLHPQWCRATFKDDGWELDYSEYNLCRLEESRIEEIIRKSIRYLRSILNDPGYRPISFRAGNWLFQPTIATARVLAKEGLKVDSSVFKGGRQHQHGLDYRPSVKNGYWWHFKDDVNVPDPEGILLEIPIYTQMVPFWKMVTGKRIGLQKKSDLSGKRPSPMERIYHLLDRARFHQPLKFDFCRMTLEELIRVIQSVLKEDQKTPSLYKPIVAIGHSKDMVDFNTVSAFLNYLQKSGIKTTTFKEAYPKCQSCV